VNVSVLWADVEIELFEKPQLAAQLSVDHTPIKRATSVTTPDTDTQQGTDKDKVGERFRIVVLDGQDRFQQTIVLHDCKQLFCRDHNL